MIELPEGLELKESPIEGLGIFATRDFPVDYNLGEFIGEYMKHKEFKERYGKDTRYCYRRMRQWDYRVAKEKRNFITYMNDGVHNFKTPCDNVVLKKWCAYTKRPIKKGEELLLNYGKNYPWNN
jgi:SET domain-containing protein